MKKGLHLHEAIIVAILSTRSRRLDKYKISQLIELRDLYKDEFGTYPNPSKIGMRISNYPNWFRTFKNGDVAVLTHVLRKQFEE